jgi:hypothetical protein
MTCVKDVEARLRRSRHLLPQSCCLVESIRQCPTVHQLSTLLSGASRPLARAMHVRTFRQAQPKAPKCTTRVTSYALPDLISFARRPCQPLEVLVTAVVQDAIGAAARDETTQCMCVATQQEEGAGPVCWELRVDISRHKIEPCRVQRAQTQHQSAAQTARVAAGKVVYAAFRVHMS